MAPVTTIDRTLFDGQWKHMINWTLERGKGNGVERMLRNENPIQKTLEKLKMMRITERKGTTK